MSSTRSPVTAGSRPECAVIRGGLSPIHCSYHSANSSYLASACATLPTLTARPAQPVRKTDRMILGRAQFACRSARHAGKHAGLVRTPLLTQDHAEPIGRVDHGDQGDQRGDLVVVVVLAHLGPGLVGHAVLGVGEPSALLGER